MRRNLQLLKLKAFSLSRLIWKRRGLWLRALMCWSIGMLVLFANQNSNYDLRFQLRGPQKVNDDIILITINREEWLSLNQAQGRWVRPPQEMKIYNDSFFWNFELWHTLLSQVMQHQPKAVGISLFFGNNVPPPSPSQLNSPIFTDRRINWGTGLDSEGRPYIPLFNQGFNNNVGLNEYITDFDGVLRNYSPYKKHLQHLALKISETAQGKPLSLNSWPPSQPIANQEIAINYLGRDPHYTQIPFSDVLKKLYSPSIFKDKIILIGPERYPGQSIQTPLGPMSKLNVLANLVDNIYYKKTIKKVPRKISALHMMAIVIASIWILSSFPQFMGFIFLLWFGTLNISLSLWIFDSYHYWIPALSPLVCIISTYIIFLSFQLTVKNYKNWKLKEEQKNILEYEQLKDNFVSLISHDLKTPIAKIQAICDRLIVQHQGAFSEDILALRKESDELHRYIQTILQVTRVESRDFKLNRETIDINEVIETVVEQLSPLAIAKRITVTTELEPMFLIEVDQILISEVIHNIIENAVKYTPEKGSIHVTSKEINDRVWIKVQDDGDGISKKDQSEIFDKFFRGKGSNPNAKGSGLGLYLVKYFVELHGGQVHLESELNVGTKVSLSLPVQHDPTQNDTEGLV